MTSRTGAVQTAGFSLVPGPCAGCAAPFTCSTILFELMRADDDIFARVTVELFWRSRATMTSKSLSELLPLVAHLGVCKICPFSTSNLFSNSNLSFPSSSPVFLSLFVFFISTALTWG